MATLEWISEFKWWDSQLPRSTLREESTSMNLETSARDVPVWVLTSTPPRPATVAGTATPCKYRCLGCHQTYILNILFSKSKGVDGQRPCLYMTTSLKRVVKYHRKKVLVVIYVFLFYVCVIVIFFIFSVCVTLEIWVTCCSLLRASPPLSSGTRSFLFKVKAASSADLLW